MNLNRLNINLFVFIILLFFSSNLYSQHGWIWQNPIPSSNITYKIKYLNNSIAYGVGEFGTVIKTVNGGNNWILLNNFTSVRLKNLYIFDSLKIFVVGESGAIYKTTNGGNNWTQINLGISNYLNEILFLDNQNGYIVGNCILKTTNGGDNWSIQTGYYFLNSINFINSNTGFIAGSLNGLYKTTNGGVNWTAIFPINANYSWSIIHFKDSLNGVLIGANYILRSTNGGMNWIQTWSDYNYYLYCYFNKNDLSYVGGDNGIILRSSNYGFNWSQLNVNLNNYTILSLNFINDINFSVLGTTNQNEDYNILVTSNGGNNWSSQIEGMRQCSLKKIRFFNANTGCVTVGDYPSFNHGAILRTTNGGNNWVINSTYDYDASDLVVFSNGIAYSCNYSKLLKSTNYGANWFDMNIGYCSYYSLSFINVNTGVALGYSYAVVEIMKTTNAGLNWNPLVGTPYDAYSSVLMSDTNIYYLINDNVLKSTDGGVYWNNIFSSDNLNKINFMNKDTGFIAGNHNIYKTTNGGNNFIISYNNQQGYICDFDFIDDNTGFAVDVNLNNSRILKTTNGGVNWQINQGITSRGLISVDAINNNIIYVAGYGGTIMKSTNGGFPISVKQGSEKIPRFNNLLQNYPNPFNPSTKIRFSIPVYQTGKEGWQVKLVIYDILGKEISTLVNDKLSPGTYEIEWNASNYSSGIYFYNLKAGDYSETKKMVLLK
jgi:photosystem II stability/assembly factor-like uncharacterized protein